MKSLTLSVEAGETLVLLGRSGSGKTTALKMVNGLLFPSAGEVLVDGTPTTAWDPVRLKRRIGYVIQEIGLFPHYTVAQNVGLVPHLENWDAPRIRRARGRRCSARWVSIRSSSARAIRRSFPEGQRQRVGVARALAADPSVLLFDEPFGAVDPVTRLDLQKQFLALRRRVGQDRYLRDARCARGADAGLSHRPAARWRARVGGHAARVPGSRRRRGARLPGLPGLEGGAAMNPDLASEILQLTLEHLTLVLVSMAIAIALAVPAGILITRRAAWRPWVLGFANVMQTIPSLALFGFLIPVPLIGGIGKRTAIVALVLYALLPILRNTLVGILGVDAAVRESAIAMGMTGSQLLWRVEMPLAARTILAGIRVATVTTIGTATIAAAIGGGGLGVFIFRGIASVDTTQILAGAVPAACIALAADAGLGLLERRWTN